MKKLLLLLVLLCGTSLMALAQDDVLGYWWMYKPGAKLPTGIVYLYQYEGKVYGRTVFSYPDVKNTDIIESYTNPVSKAKHIEGNPFTVGMDIMWSLTWDEQKGRYVNGYILDPENKKPYRSEIWLTPEGLSMRGMLQGVNIGKTALWKRASVTDLPSGVPPITGNLTPTLYYPR